MAMKTSIDIARLLGHKRAMFKPLILTLAAGLTVLSACGQGGTVEGKVADARARNAGPAIWTVSDHDSTLYLFGTVHLLSPEINWQRSDMEEIFRDAGTVFFEIDTGPEAQIQATVMTQSLGFRTDGLRLSDQLDSYQLKLLDAASHNGDIALATLDTMKPWLASEFLTIAAAAQNGLTPELSADDALKSRARAQGKNILYLDTMQGQIRRAAEQPVDTQIKLLTDSMEGFNTLGADLEKIARAWSSGQTSYLERELIEETEARAPELYARFFKDVNPLWAAPLTRFMEDNGTGFAAIGIGHLLGAHSVQEIMREQGYEVRRYYAFQGEPVIATLPLRPVGGGQ